MKYFAALIAMWVVCSSCVVSSKKYNEITTKVTAYSVVIDNQNKEVESLKTLNKAMTNRLISLSQDSIRAVNKIKMLENNYSNVVEDGATSTIATMRKAEEYETAIKKNNSLLRELNSEIVERNTRMGLIEKTVVTKFQNKIADGSAVLSQTKSGFNLELDDTAILSDSTMMDSINVFVTKIIPFLQINDDLTLTIESYVTVADSISSPFEVWEMSLKKGAVYANMFLEKGLEPSRIKVTNSGSAYPYTSPFKSNSIQITIIKFNLDATHIIEKFDKLVINNSNKFSILNNE
ncbi:MAG: hypothetical protein R3Y04_03585 [Rikenellaceae bacterium]